MDVKADTQRLETSRKLPKGILHPQTSEQKFTLNRYQPSQDIGYFVQHYWTVRWDLRGQEPYASKVIAYPNINLVFEKDGSRIYGVNKTTSVHILQGHGHVFGIKFRPGGFYPFLNSPVSMLTGGSIGLEEVFGPKIPPLHDEILDQPTDGRMVQRVEAFLTEHLPERDPNVEIVASIVSAIRDQRDILKVEDVVERTGMNIRTLQRLFARYVGVSPKSVIQRFRLHEAAERIDREGLRDWLDISIELGYYDHSHFIRDFRTVVGISPEEYRQYG
ncbi:helix-turn-helix domain-containing protein [Brevibacillus migulae]|uniref:helix-turn-helix domain-containing protein n=1 Tax=Brevibacillus migulae TaxID=1644114 RepID=UPI00106E203B|nr:helix-turn-helix domain-containing protein [Brevibacillus migulae]